MRALPLLLLMSLPVSAAAGPGEKCNDMQVQLGLCDADGTLSGPLFSEEDMAVVRNATADDFAFMDDPKVRESTERLGKSLDAMDKSTGEYLRMEGQVKEDLEALETLMRENPALFEALIAEEQQRAEAELRAARARQAPPVGVGLKPLDKPLVPLIQTQPGLKPVKLVDPPQPSSTGGLTLRPKLKPLNVELPALDTRSPTPRLDALRLVRKGRTLDLTKVPTLPAGKVGVITPAAHVDADAVRPSPHVRVGEAKPYVVGPVVTPERTWAGWAWETAGSAWIWAFGS